VWQGVGVVCQHDSLTRSLLNGDVFFFEKLLLHQIYKTNVYCRQRVTSYVARHYILGQQ